MVGEVVEEVEDAVRAIWLMYARAFAVLSQGVEEAVRVQRPPLFFLLLHVFTLVLPYSLNPSEGPSLLGISRIGDVIDEVECSGPNSVGIYQHVVEVLLNLLSQNCSRLVVSLGRRSFALRAAELYVP